MTVVETRDKKTISFNVGMTICAWLAFILVLFIVIKGDVILQEVSKFYPEFSFPAFFIPWFLLVISSVQKLRVSLSKAPLQNWILKTSLPIFVFVFPFFSQLLRSTIDNITFVEFEPYCVYFAIIVLFMVHFFPFIRHQQAK